MVRTLLVALTVSLLMTSAALAQEKQEPAKKPEPAKKQEPAQKVVGAQEKVIPTGNKKELAWFDLENCAMCKCMGEHKDLIEKMKWETHLLDNGALSLCTIPADAKSVMEKCKKEMESTVAQLKSGKELPLCGFCTSYAALMEAGAKVQEFETANGMASVITSDKPEVVKKIHEHAKRTIKEYETMMASKEKPSK